MSAKVVEKVYEYNLEKMTDISAYLFFVKSVLSVIGDLDSRSPWAFKSKIGL